METTHSNNGDHRIAFKDWRVRNIEPGGTIVTESPDVAEVMRRLIELAQERIWVILTLEDGRARFVVPDEAKWPERYEEEELILKPDAEAGVIRIVARSRDGAKCPSDGNAAKQFYLDHGKQPSEIGSGHWSAMKRRFPWVAAVARFVQLYLHPEKQPAIVAASVPPKYLE